MIDCLSKAILLSFKVGDGGFHWLRLSASTIGGTGSNPDWGAKIPHGSRPGKKKSEQNNNENTTYQFKKNYMGKVKINKVRGSSEAGLVLS